MITVKSGTLQGSDSFFAGVSRWPGWTLIEDRESPYRFVWMKREEMKTLTYCEGDVIFETAESEEEWENHLSTLREYYGTLLID